MLGHTPKERRIFRFHDGVRPRRLDPLKCYRVLLQTLEGDLDGVWRLALQARYPKREKEKEGEPPVPPAPVPMDALHAEELLLAAARVAFGLPEVAETPDCTDDPDGVPDLDVWRVLNEFTDFMAGKGSGGGDSRPTSPPTPASPPASPGDSATPSTSASTSTTAACG